MYLKYSNLLVNQRFDLRLKYRSYSVFWSCFHFRSILESHCTDPLPRQYYECDKICRPPKRNATTSFYRKIYRCEIE